MTGLYNRRYFNKIYEQEINRAIRTNEYLSFAILDIDYFKNYNDTLGHIAGDNALKAVSKILLQAFNRSSDYVFRMGGEEFCVIMVGVEPEKALQHMHNLQNEIKSIKIPHPSSQISSYLTISVGLYISKVWLNEEVDFYKEADYLLYKAKLERNCIYSNIS